MGRAALADMRANPERWERANRELIDKLAETMAEIEEAPKH